MNAWVYGVFNAPIKSEQQLNNNSQLILTFAKGNKQPIYFKYALSYISQEQAKKNLENEIPDWAFDEMKQNGQKIWAETLGQIEVEGDNMARKRTFYSALYRCYERMVDITEDGKYYSNYDGKVHEDAQDFYIDDWIWDTHLAHHPLRALLDPDKENEAIFRKI